MFILFTILNFRIKKWKLSKASVTALDFVACQSKKKANTSKLCKYSV